MRTSQDRAIVLLRLHGVDHSADQAGGPLVFHRSGFGSVSPYS
ncbi:hypothetical protein [Actinoplanes sp. DH11]|nr:hypothetical protein [Actinoplanes sp. DH11]